MEGDMLCIRLFARRSVWRRLRRGRLPSVTMALSVKSIASCWSLKKDWINLYPEKKVYKAYPCNTQIFDSRDFVACRYWIKRSREIFDGSANL